MGLDQQVGPDSTAAAAPAVPAGATPTVTRGAGAGIIRAGALSMLALVAVGLTRVIHGSLVSHATDKPTYGLVGSLLATSMIASLILPGGVSSSSSKFVAYYRGAGDVAASWGVHRFLARLGLISSLLLGVGAAAIAKPLFDLGWADTIGVGLLTAAYSLYTVDKAAMYGHGLVSRYARIELITSALAIVATIVVITAGWTTYLLPLSIGYTAFVLVIRWQLRSQRVASGAGFSTAFDRRQVWIFTILASIGTLGSQGFLQGTQLLAGHFTTRAEVANFAAAVALVAPLYFLPRAMALALFPAMAGAQGAGDVDAVRRHVDVSTRSLAVALTPMFAVALLAAPLVLTIFGGREYAQGAGVLRLILVACFLAVLQVPAVNALASGTLRHTRVPVAAAVIGCALGLGVVAVLGGPYGTIGVAVAYLIGTTVTATIPIVTVWRIYRLDWAATLLKCTGLTALVAVATLLGPLHRWSWLSAVAIVAALALIAVVLRRELHSLISLVRRRTGAGPGPSATAVAGPGPHVTVLAGPGPHAGPETHPSIDPLADQPIGPTPRRPDPSESATEEGRT